MSKTLTYENIKIKSIIDHPDYLISENGDVFSKKSGGIKKLTPIKTKKGYFRIGLHTNGKVTIKSIHSIVLTAFDRPRKAGEETRHLNGIKTDNRLSNIKWGTRKQNDDDRWKVHKIGPRNENHWKCKLSDKQVKEIRDLYATGKYYQKDLAKKYKITQSNISCIVMNKTRRIV